MRHEPVIWAYSDMDAARRLWPRVKALIEQQVANGELALSLGDQRRVIAAVVNDLLERERQGKRGRCAPRSLERILRRFRKTENAVPQRQSA